MWLHIIVRNISTLQRSPSSSPLRSTASSTDLHFHSLSSCACLCVWGYLSQFGMRALQLHTDQRRQGQRGSESQGETERESSWRRELALKWIVFFLVSFIRSTHQPPLSQCTLECVGTYYVHVCVCERHTDRKKGNVLKKITLNLVPLYHCDIKSPPPIHTSFYFYRRQALCITSLT